MKIHDLLTCPDNIKQYYYFSGTIEKIFNLIHFSVPLVGQKTVQEDPVHSFLSLYKVGNDMMHFNVMSILYFIKQRIM